MTTREPLEELAEEHLLARTRRTLRAQVTGPDVSEAMIADAIGMATLTLVRELPVRAIDNLGGYFFRVAKNELLRLLREAQRHVELSPDNAPRPGERSSEDVHWRVESGLVYEFLLALLDQWAAQREADVVRLVLEAAYDGVDMGTGDFLEAFEETTGQPITTPQFYDLKSRGLRRLRRDLEMLAAQDDFEAAALIDS